MNRFRKALFLATLIGTFFAITGQSLHAQSVVIGTVKSQTIVAAMDEFKAVEAQVQQATQVFADTLNLYRQKFDQERVALEQATTLTPEQRAGKQQELVRFQQAMVQYQQEKEKLLMNYQDQLLAPVRQKVIEAIKEIAKRQKLNVVMEESSMIYVDKSLDITYKVLEYLNQNQ